MATPKVQAQSQQKVESQPAPQPETAPTSAPPETPEKPESQATTPAQDQERGRDSNPHPGDGDGKTQADTQPKQEASETAKGDGQGDSEDGGEDSQDRETRPHNQMESTKAAPEKQAQAKANDGESDDTQNGEDGDQGDNPYTEMRGETGGGILDWDGRGDDGPGNENGEAAGNQPEGILQLEDGDKSDNSFNPMAEAGGIGAGLLGLSPAHYEDGDQPGEYREDEYQEVQEETRPAVRHSRRPKPIQDDDEERAHKAAVELGRRGGIKSGQARRIRSLKINPPQMQPVSAPPEPAKRRKRPYWFKPPRLPGQRA